MGLLDQLRPDPVGRPGPPTGPGTCGAPACRSARPIVEPLPPRRRSLPQRAEGVAVGHREHGVRLRGRSSHRHLHFRTVRFYQSSGPAGRPRGLGRTGGPVVAMERPPGPSLPSSWDEASARVSAPPGRRGMGRRCAFNGRDRSSHRICPPPVVDDRRRAGVRGRARRPRLGRCPRGQRRHRAQRLRRLHGHAHRRVQREAAEPVALHRPDELRRFALHVLPQRSTTCWDASALRLDNPGAWTSPASTPWSRSARAPTTCGDRT